MIRSARIALVDPMTAGSAGEARVGVRRVGRPSLVDRERIAVAASEIGLSDLTMRSVAERLGVSVTTLYYHVRDLDDLKKLVAQRSAERHEVPVAAEQHWAEWLAEWAEHSRAAFAAEPGLLEHFLNGTLALGNIKSNLEAIVAFLERQGFSPADALAAHALVSSCAIGTAVSEIRSANLDNGDEGQQARLREMGRSRRLKPLTKEQGRPGGLPTFRQQLCTILIGVAARRGEPLEPILELMERPFGT